MSRSALGQIVGLVVESIVYLHSSAARTNRGVAASGRLLEPYEADRVAKLKKEAVVMYEILSRTSGRIDIDKRRMI